MERRARALEDPFQTDRDLFAGSHGRVIGNAVEREAERSARPLPADLVPVLLAAQGDAALAAGERMSADPERLRRDHEVLDDEALLDAVHVHHLPAFEVRKVDRMLRAEEPGAHERP